MNRHCIGYERFKIGIFSVVALDIEGVVSYLKVTDVDEKCGRIRGLRFHRHPPQLVGSVLAQLEVRDGQLDRRGDLLD